ncbi:hypothetical protein [Pseudomonas sp. NPDC096950]|uniref:hypothetical protein n=1 Tax=Pseudomonas sp. NPDC096950 TaxID=3364485 RepID=UPI00383A7184
MTQAEAEALDQKLDEALACALLAHSVPATDVDELRLELSDLEQAFRDAACTVDFQVMARDLLTDWLAAGSWLEPLLKTCAIEGKKMMRCKIKLLDEYAADQQLAMWALSVGTGRFGPQDQQGKPMQYLFIIVAVAAIVIYSAQHDLTTFSQFMDYVRDDMLSLMLWLAVAIVALGALYVVMRINRNK